MTTIATRPLAYARAYTAAQLSAGVNLVKGEYALILGFTDLDEFSAPGERKKGLLCRLNVGFAFHPKVATLPRMTSAELAASPAITKLYNNASISIAVREPAAIKAIREGFAEGATSIPVEVEGLTLQGDKTNQTTHEHSGYLFGYKPGGIAVLVPGISAEAEGTKAAFDARGQGAKRTVTLPTVDDASFEAIFNTGGISAPAAPVSGTPAISRTTPVVTVKEIKAAVKAAGGDKAMFEEVQAAVNAGQTLEDALEAAMF